MSCETLVTALLLRPWGENGARHDVGHGERWCRWPRSGAVCWAWRLRSEVEVLSWGPDRGNPTLMRQGRGPELTGWSQCGCLRCGASVRAGLKEAIGVSWSRTRVKRRKASFGWVSWPPAATPGSCRSLGRIGDVIAAKSQRLTPGDLPGSGREVGRPEDERTEADGPAEVGGSRTTGRRGNAR